MKLRWTPRARADLKEIGRYVGRDSPEAARRLLGRLRQQAKRAAVAPRSGRIVPELDRADTREVIAGNYRLVYRVLDEAIDVVAVFEGHRLMPDIEQGDDAC